MEYQLKYISPEELGRIYPRIAKDFVPEERKTEGRLHRQMEEGLETGWLLMADGKEAGYAFVLQHPAVKLALIDYISVYEQGQGYGTALINLLKDRYKEGGLLAEVESVVPGLSEEEKAYRLLRQRFYRKVEFQPTAVKNEIYTVPYLVHVWSMNLMDNPTATAAKALDDLYALQLPHEEYCKHVHIEVPEQD